MMVQLGSARKGKELRIGTVRRPPRGVKKEDYSKFNYYDVWLPVLSPVPELMKIAHTAEDEKSWNQFKKKFRTQMGKQDAAHVLDLLAALSKETDFSIGCYCEDENHCHRSVLRELLLERGARIE